MLEEYQDILTTEELAQILRLNERTIIKLAKEGQLPAAKIASQFRFSKEKIIEWLELQMHQYSDGLLADMEKGIIEKAVSIHRLLLPTHVKVTMHASSKEEVLQELVTLAESTGIVKNQEELHKCLQAREELCTTAVDNGVAFPHPRQASWNLVSQMLIVIGISANGIEYGAIDNNPVQIFVMPVIPILALHLQVLSRLARVFSDIELIDRIKTATSPEAVVTIIREKEDQLALINGNPEAQLTK